MSGHFGGHAVSPVEKEFRIDIDGVTTPGWSMGDASAPELTSIDDHVNLSTVKVRITARL